MSEINDSNDVASPEDEFAGLSPAPPSRSPLVAIAMIGLAAFTVFHLRHDLRYAMTDKSPVSLRGEFKNGPGQLVGRYVSVSGIPGRADSLFVESRGGQGRETMFRLLDFSPPLFVRADATVEHVNTTGTWTGRLERFADVGWASSIRDYYESTPRKATRALDLVTLKGHLADPSIALRDRRGAALTLAPDTELTVVYKPSEYAIYLSRDKYPKKEDAQHELVRILDQMPGGLGQEQPEAMALKAGEDTSDAFVFLLPLETSPARQNVLMGLIERASETSTPIDIEAHARTVKAPLSALKPRLESVHWDDVTEVRVEETTRPVDLKDALVVVEGEAPTRYTWTVFVVALLCSLAAWNVWYLARPRRA